MAGLDVRFAGIAALLAELAASALNPLLCLLETQLMSY